MLHLYRFNFNFKVCSETSEPLVVRAQNYISYYNVVYQDSGHIKSSDTAILPYHFEL